MDDQSNPPEQAELGAVSIEETLQATASSLGCHPNHLVQSGITAVVRAENDDRALRTFVRGDTGVVLLPAAESESLEVEPREIGELIAFTERGVAVGSVIDLAGGRLLVGEDSAEISVLDAATLRRPMRVPAAIVIDPKPAVLDMLRSVVLPHEWADGHGDAAGVRRVGALAGGTLVALASVEPVVGRLARLRVIVAPGYRRRGFGRTVLLELVRTVLREGNLPYARLGIGDLAARALATTVGFVSFARTLTMHVIAVRDTVFDDVAPVHGY